MVCENHNRETASTTHIKEINTDISRAEEREERPVSNTCSNQDLDKSIYNTLWSSRVLSCFVIPSISFLIMRGQLAVCVCRCVCGGGGGDGGEEVGYPSVIEF